MTNQYNEPQSFWATPLAVAIALVVLIMPYLFLVFFLMSEVFMFLPLFYISWLPSSVIGWFLMYKCQKQYEIYSLKEEVIRGVGLVLGVFGIFGGLFALGILYVITS